MTTSAEFLDTLIGTTSSGIDRGKISYLRSAAKSYGNGYSAAEARFWGDLWDATKSSEPAAVHANPTKRFVRSSKTTTLTAADLMWLQRLPSDPAKITADDASALAGMASQTASNTSDGRLVRSILRPVEQHHARLERESELKNLQRPLPKIPATVQPALAAVISRELPDLTEDEAFNRAGQQIRTALATRSSNHANQIHAVRAQLAEDQQAVA